MQEFLALKWAVTKSFHDYLYGNAFAAYSGNKHLNYVLTMAKLDATGHQWIVKLVKFNFTIYYCSEKSNVNADVLSRIPWNQNIEADTVRAILKATVDGPDGSLCLSQKGLGPEGRPSY